MGLPAEIRRQIFSLVTNPNGIQKEVVESSGDLEDLVRILHWNSRPASLTGAYKQGRAPGHQLLYVSRTCYREAVPLLYDRQCFYLRNSRDRYCSFHTFQQQGPSLFELRHMKHPAPHSFTFIRELAFQPTSETSVVFVEGIERDFPSLRVLRPFRRLSVDPPRARSTCRQRAVWMECYRLVLSAALLIKNHSMLKSAKCSDWQRGSLRTVTVTMASDKILSKYNVCESHKYSFSH